MPGIIYLTAACIFLAGATLLLASALLMTLVPKLRPLAKRIALGVPGSAVGVLAFQVAAVPVSLATLWTFFFPVFYFHGSGGTTTNPLIVLLSLGGLLAAVAFFGTASLGGLVLGWRVANALGQGIPLRSFLASDETWQAASSIFRRPYRLPFLLWLVTPFAFGAACVLKASVGVADASGAYRAELDSMETHILGIADGSWTYRRDGQSHGAATGTWVHEQGESNGSAVVISFKVEARAALLESAPLAPPGFVFGSLSRDCFGRLSVCFGTESQICYRRQSEAGEKVPQRGRQTGCTLWDARASLRLSLPASCLL